MSARCSLMSLTPGVSTSVSRFSSTAAGYSISTWWVADWPCRLARGLLVLALLASPSTVSQSPSAAASIGLRSPDSVTAVARACGPCVMCASSAVVGVMPVGSTGAAQQRVDERRLAVVELAQHDRREALVVQLGQARVADVARHPRQPGRFGRAGQVGEHGADRRLLLVERRERLLAVGGHRSTAISCATFASHSSFDVPAGAASGAAPGARPVPIRLRKYVVSANRRSAATRLGRYGCVRVSSSSRPTPLDASSSCARYSAMLTSL